MVVVILLSVVPQAKFASRDMEEAFMRLSDTVRSSYQLFEIERKSLVNGLF